ncbi:MAG TPA: hypothetical protein VGC91_19555 [Pyrinomonadaceae bacterium]
MSSSDPILDQLRVKLKNVTVTDKTLLDDKTPPDVIVTNEPRTPVVDPTMGIPVTSNAQGTPLHRLVTIGDSLTHGFQSGAIFNTHISYPAIIAYEMGWLDQFRRPSYRGFGGLPLNIEFLLRDLEDRYGSRVDWWEAALAAFRVRHYMGEIEDWWERGPGNSFPNLKGINHNLAVYGWDLRDALSRDADLCHKEIPKPKDQFLKQIVENANQRAAIYVLESARNSAGLALTPFQAAAALADEGEIETLIVLLGANNALGSVVNLKVAWSGDGYDDLQKKQAYTVWRPIHFKAELDKVVAEVEKIRARHVIWGTVPHVTIAPIARGVTKNKISVGSRYFPFYTRPWIADGDFDAKDDPNITSQQARAIDSAIDQYNYYLENAVSTARHKGLDWYLLDVAGMLDRLASRRYIDDLAARPSWWSKYQLPPELMMLNPVPDSKFFVSDKSGRIAGGLFSLDGVHPTTVCYGLLAQEFINIMQRAGVRFYLGDGKTVRSSPVKVDFTRLIKSDTLISDPPKSIKSDLKLLGWADEKIDFIRRMLRRGV